MALHNSSINQETSEKKSSKLPQTFAYYLAFIFLGLLAAAMGPTLTALAEQTRSAINQISFLFTFRSLGYLMGSLLAGRIYDRLSGHVIMAVALCGMVITMLLVPIIPLLWVMVVVMLLMGLSEGCLDVGGNTLLMWLHRGNVGPFMNGLHFFFGVGTFLSPVIIAQLVLLTGDITWGYWVIALLGIPVILNLVRYPSPKNIPAPVEGTKGKIHLPLVILTVLLFLLYVGSEVSFGGWIHTYTLKLGLYGETTAAYLTSFFWGALTVGRLAGIPIAARFKPEQILGADIIGCILSVGLILFWPQSRLMTWIGTFGAGFSMASMFPATLTLSERRMHITGRITSWFFIGSSLGGMIVPTLIGQLFKIFGPWVTMLTIFVDVILTGLVFMALLATANRLDISNDTAGEGT